MSPFRVYKHKMYIKQSGNRMDTQYNIDTLLLCLLNVCTTEQSQMDGLSEEGEEGGREGEQEVNYNGRMLFVYKVLALN